MQKFITPDEQQEPRPYRLRVFKLKTSRCVPSPQLIENLMAYALALRVIKTKRLGDLYILMN